MNKRLYRSSEDKVLFGVCGGIAEYFDIDSVLIRLLMVVFALTGGGILFYIFAAVIMRERTEPTPFHGRSASTGAAYGPGGAETYSDAFTDAEPRTAEEAESSYATGPGRPRAQSGKGSGVVIVGLILIIIGVFFLIDRFVHIFSWIDFRMVLAVVLVLVGIYFVAKR